MQLNVSWHDDLDTHLDPSDASSAVHRSHPRGLHASKNPSADNAPVSSFSQKHTLSAVLGASPHHQTINESLTLFLKVGIVLNDATGISNHQFLRP